MRKTMLIFPTMIVAAVLFGKGPQRSSGPAALDSLINADAEFGKALAAGPVQQAYLGFLASDGILIAQGQPIITGKEAIRDYIAEQPQRTLAHWHPLRAGISGAADMGYISGTVEITLKDADGNRKSGPGVYLLFWKKQGSDWKIAAILINPARSATTVSPDLQASSQE